jgi:diguanylate cyclase (GGDEF)-like protein
LISENAILTAQSKGTNVRIKIDPILENKNEIDEDALMKMKNELKALGVFGYKMFLENGKVVYPRPETEKAGMASKNEFKAIIKAIQKSSFEDKIFHHELLDQGRIITLYIPISYGLDQTVVLKAPLNLTDMDRQRTYLLRQCMVIAILVILIHIIFAVILAKIIINPVIMLTEATDKISAGDFNARVNILRNDEIGRLAISFNEMSVKLARMQDEARGANPLTGLPGNISIAQEIDRGLQSGAEIAIIYADLDNFKAYNDKYGFTRGDDAILYSRDCFIESVRLKGDEHTFLGHEGGDDFVVIASHDNFEEICKAIIATFDRDISQFYTETDSRNGYIESVNRQNERMRFPIMTISLAVVTNKYRQFSNHVEMVAVVAEMKKVAKKMQGSCYAVDRRTS